MVLHNGGRETALQSITPVEEQNQRNYSTPERTIWANDSKGWFSCGYGPFRRVFGASSDAARQMVAPPTERVLSTQSTDVPTSPK